MVAVEAVDRFDMCRDTVFEVTQKKNKSFTLAHLQEMRGQPTHNKHTHTANGHTNARTHIHTQHTQIHDEQAPTHPPIHTHTHTRTHARTLTLTTHIYKYTRMRAATLWSLWRRWIDSTCAEIQSLR